MQNDTKSQPAGVIGGALTPVRICAKCEEEKPTSEFGKFHRGPGGLNHKCKACCKKQGQEWRAANREAEAARCREWRKANPETRKAVLKKYYEENREKIAEQAKAYYTSNPEKMSERGRAYYEANKERCLEVRKAWALKNPDKVLAKGRAWRQRNPDKVNAKCSRRRAKTRAVVWADKKAITKFYRDARALSKKTGVSHEVDHIYPLNGETVSGLHVEGNLQIIKSWDNRSKKNRLPGAFAHELWDPHGPDVFYGGEVAHG